MDDYLQARDRSYAVRRIAPEGTYVRIIGGSFRGEDLGDLGLIGSVEEYHNAGFRGIEAAVRLETPLTIGRENLARVYNLSAGYLEPLCAALLGGDVCGLAAGHEGEHVRLAILEDGEDYR